MRYLHTLLLYWKLITVLAFCVVTWLILAPVFQRARENSMKSSCYSNLKQLSLAVMQYSQDYDERFPLIRVKAVPESRVPFKKPYGWADALYPYGKSLKIYQCVNEENFKYGAENPVESQFTDFYYNSNLDGTDLGKLSSPSTTILFGEGNNGTDGSDARYNRDVIPQQWLADSKSPVYRHLDGSFYAFVDGHVRWFKPDDIHTERKSRKNNDYSFALK